MAAAVAAEPPPCRAWASVQPERAAVGQQILYRLRIARRADVARVDWEAPPRFPGFRVERLPAGAEWATGSEGPLAWFEREERWALFAARPGDHPIGGVRLACAAARPQPAGEVASIDAAPVRLRAYATPALGRPQGFDGTIGPLSVRARVDRSSIALGESVRLSVIVRGTGNLWALRTPLRPGDLDAHVERFPRPPELALLPGEPLQMERRFHIDLVPHRVGPLPVPALRVAYYDPEAGGYDSALSRPLVVQVRPRPDAGRATDPISIRQRGQQ